MGLGNFNIVPEYPVVSNLQRIDAGSLPLPVFQKSNPIFTLLTDLNQLVKPVVIPSVDDPTFPEGQRRLVTNSLLDKPSYFTKIIPFLLDFKKTAILSKSILNPGSVGQPRDHDNRASFAFFDPENFTWELRRVPYEISSVQQRIKKSGLPWRHALRLQEGW